METQPSVQSPFQKLNFGNNSEKVSKSRHQSFFVLSKFTGFLYFVPKILFRIVDKVSVFGVILVRIFCIRTEYAEIRISPYSVRMWEIWTGIISAVDTFHEVLLIHSGKTLSKTIVKICLVILEVLLFLKVIISYTPKSDPSLRTEALRSGEGT